MSNKEKNNNKEKKKWFSNGFMAALKIKDPQTLEAATEKTNATCLLTAIIFAVFAVIFLIVFWIIGILFILAGAGIIAYLKFTWTIQNKRNFCAQCGTRINYQDGVSWEVIEVNDKDCSVNPNSTSKQVCRKRIATVEFTCTCLKCGEEKTFTKNFTIAEWYTNGTLKEYNLDSMAKGYFKI